MERFKTSFGDILELVRQGYKKAAVPYNEQKDTAILNLPIFQVRTFTHYIDMIINTWLLFIVLMEI